MAQPNMQTREARGRENTMKAIVHHEYGSPEVLTLQDVDRPAVKDDEVRLRVRASSVNPYDWHFLRGAPAVVRLIAGLRRPRQPIPGADVAGHVETVGPNVTQFRAGDELFALVLSRGCLAEYVSVPEQVLGAKPANLTFEQAAAVPLAALTALQSLRDHTRIGPGDKVLINGSSGGVGTFAVQIAKAFGAEVTAVCSTRNVDMVRGLGADHVVDYTQEDFTNSGQRYDVLIDNAGNRRPSDLRRVLRPDGVFISVAGVQPVTFWFGVVRTWVTMLSASLRWSQKVVLLPTVKPRQDDLRVLTRLIESGKVTPVIDRTYPLSDAPEALHHLEDGHARGKIVITV